MKQFHTLIEKSEWAVEQELKGNTIICNAPRPLYGNEVSNDWDQPFIHGRHYSALNPKDDRFDKWMKDNESLDARQLVFVDQEMAIKAGLEYYQKHYPKYVDRINQNDSAHIEMLIEKGLDYLNDRLEE